MSAKYWMCRCGTRNERIKRKCTNPACARSRTKKRVPKHAVTLRDDSYERYVEINRLIHGIEDEACGVCDKARGQERRHDRDHGHHKGSSSYGKPRGLACVSCNILMPRTLTTEGARLIYEYLKRVDDYYSKAA